MYGSEVTIQISMGMFVLSYTPPLQYGDSYMDDTDEHLLHEVFNKVEEMVC